MGRLQKVLLFFVLMVLLSTVAASATEVNVWLVDWNDATQKLYEDTIIPGFEAANPGVKLNVSWFSWSGYWDKMTAALAGGSVPDVFQAGGTALRLAEQGYAQPLTKYYDNWKYKNEIPKEILAPGLYKGEVWSLPYLSAPRILVYRKPMFEEAGLNSNNPPRNWDELKSAVQKLMKRDGDQITRMGMQLDLSGKNVFVGWQPLLEQAGGTLFDENNEPAFVSEEGIKAVKFYAELMRVQSYLEAINGRSFNFWSGGFGMMIANNNGIGENLRRGTITSDEIGVALPPKDKKSAANVFSDVLAIGSTSAHPELAWAFIAYAMEPTNNALYNETMSYIPTMKSAWSSDYVRKSPFLGTFAQALPISQSIPMIETFGKMRVAVGEELTPAIRGEVAPEIALEKAADRWMGLMPDAN